MTSQTGKQIIAIHILPDMSRSKDNQIMKFGKLIEYDMKNIFLEKSYPKCCGEISPKIEHICGSIIRIFIHFVFIVCPNRGTSKYFETNV